MRKIILDVDTGNDDALAIITAALSPDIELKAITCVHGNLPLKNTTENTLRVAELVCPDVPVYAGCSRPMVQDIYPGRLGARRHWATLELFDEEGNPVFVHNPYLPLPEAKKKPEEQHAVSFLVETLRKEKCTVVAVGPATNVAMALRMDPDIVNNIEELVVMGGGVHRYNLSQAAEANFFWDPDAAAIMLQAKTRITLLPLDATSTATFSEEEGNEIAAIGNEVAKFFAGRILDLYKYHKYRGTSQTDDVTKFDAAIHDVLCILYLIDPSILVDVRHQTPFVHIGGGVCEGMLVVDTRAGMPVEGDVHIAYKVDKEKVKNMLMELLKKA